MPISTTADRIQSRLLALASIFLGLVSAALTLSPTSRLHAWTGPYLWQHWLGYLVWLGLFWTAHRQSARYLPGRDPYLLPAAALLSGWGLLTIWRLIPGFGLRQTVWLALSVVLLALGWRIPGLTGLLRRYKYVWLTGGLLLTGLTLIFGTNPLGYGPRMWLGCCGLYFQPSEPLKLLLVVYLAAYLSDRQARATWSDNGRSPALLPLLAPTLIMTGLALALLLVQRDLGTASIFLFLYAAIVYLNSGRKRVLLAAGAAIALSALVGTLLFDVVQVRVDAWLNPWAEPGGDSFQIIQSLLAVANGGFLGRGPGMGSPGVVPVPHSDFIFTAISEEYGLAGALALLAVIALFAQRGILAALRATDAFRRLLAAGLTTFLVGQSILIIGGNLRLLPLTGVTLPFVSYGGSSLVTSFFSLLLILHISDRQGESPAPIADERPFLGVFLLLAAGLSLAALATGFWSSWRGPELLERVDNPRRFIDERYIPRGDVLDRSGSPILTTTGEPGSYQRITDYPPLSNVLGYDNPLYGQTGLEASMDAVLRGVEGQPPAQIWLDRLLYGQSPPGLDVRLSLDLQIQQVADTALGDHDGALVLLNAREGRILAMTSHPGFDSNRLEETWPELVENPDAPLLNRAVQGRYQPGTALAPFFLANALVQGPLPDLPQVLSYDLDGLSLECATVLEAPGWPAAAAAGCPVTQFALAQQLGPEGTQALFRALGFYEAPQIHLPVDGIEAPGPFQNTEAAMLGQGELLVSPLQMALAATTLSEGGLRPAAYFVTAIETPAGGFQTLPPQGEGQQALSSEGASTAALMLTNPPLNYWQSAAVIPTGDEPENGVRYLTWYLAGTSPELEGPPLALALVVEEDNLPLAVEVGQAVMEAGLEQ